MKWTIEIMDTFEYKTPEKCIIKDCGNPVDWYSEEYDIGLCSICYNEIMDEIEENE